MRTGVLAVTRDGKVAVMNSLAHRILSVSEAATTIGRPLFEVLDGHRELARIVLSGFELTHLPNRAELRLKKSGKVIGYTLSLVKDDEDRVTGAALFFKDLTRVEQLEERERLRDRLAALGEMAAAIAHDVKNPLAGIEVMAGILRRQLPDSPDAQATLGDIIAEAKMANAIVLEVLEFVRPIRLQVETADVARVLHDAVAAATTHLNPNGVRVALELPGDVPQLQADGQQLRQLFMNLVVNAFEALGNKGTVRIEVTVELADYELGSESPQDARIVVIEVSDDGPGIPAELSDRVFSPFFTTKPRGNGLGLAIVRKIVVAHEGQIDVTAPADGGTRFRVKLPVAGPREWYTQAG
jgi:signal transduction histidine kinase